MKILIVNKSSLTPLKGNPRKLRDPENIERLVKLIEEHGFQNPLQVWREPSAAPTDPYIILCGNHRFEAGLLAGLKSFPCIEYKGPRDKAIARAVSDNKSNEWTTWDDNLLRECLTEIAAFDGATIDDITGFSMADIEKYIREMPAAPAESTQKPKPKSKQKAKHISRPGDVWTIGDNKISCGALDFKDVDIILISWSRRTGGDPVRHDGIKWSALCQNG